jgi:hypothetical protein
VERGRMTETAQAGVSTPVYTDEEERDS